MKLTLSSHEQKTLLLAGVLGLVVLWVYGTFVLGMLRSASELGGKVRNAKQQLAILQAAVANEAALREQYRRVDEAVAALRKVLPSEDEVPVIIETLSQLAGQSQVKILTIFPQRTPETLDFPGLGALAKGTLTGTPGAGATVTKEVLIQIDALGGYHQLGTFLSLVESGEKPMQVANLHISSDAKEPKRQRIKLLIRALFAVNQPVAPKTQTAPQPS